MGQHRDRREEPQRLTSERPVAHAGDGLVPAGVPAEQARVHRAATPWPVGRMGPVDDEVGQPERAGTTIRATTKGSTASRSGSGRRSQPAPGPCRSVRRPGPATESAMPVPARVVNSVTVATAHGPEAYSVRFIGS